MTESFRDRIEAWFAGLGRWTYDHHWLTVLLVAVVSVPLIAQLPKMRIDNRTERLFLEGDPALGDYRDFREQFGTDEYIVVALQPREVFDLEFLGRLREVHRDLEEGTPHVAEVTSLVNARNTFGEGDTLFVEDLMQSWPSTTAEVGALRERVLSNPFYVNSLISLDGSMATIVVRPRSVNLPDESEILEGFDDDAETASESAAIGDGQLSSVEFSEMVRAVDSIVERHRTADLPIYIGGGPVVTDAINRAVPRDLARLIPLSILVIAVFLFLLFRRLAGVALPLFTVVLALFTTLGVMAAIGIPMTNITTILTSFLTVVGVADSVHILSRYFQRLEVHADPRTAVAEALHHSGLAVLMTSLTTAAGLLSFVVADVRPIADLGIVAPIGVICALILTVTLLPALLAIFPVKQRKTPRRNDRVDRLLAGVARISCAHYRLILAVAIVLVIVSVIGMTRLRFSQNGLKWFKEGAAVRVATEVIDGTLGGTLTIEPVIDTGVTDGLLDPGFLGRLDRSMSWAETIDRGEVRVSKATSLNTIVKEINRALHGNDESFYRIPDDGQLIAQELLLFEGTGSQDLEQVVDRDFRTVRATLTVPFRDAFQYVDLVDEITDHFEVNYPEADVTVTGSNVLYVRMFRNVITTMAKSYVISLSVITVLMIVLLGRLRVGLLSMVPNLLPLVMILGVMGWMDIPLDMSTVLIGSIAIGLVVDDTIHFMHNFRRDFDEFGNVDDAVARTLNTAGRAILITSVVLAGGFFSCVISELRSSVIYGFLMGTTVLFALVADYFFTPALMVVTFGRKKTRSGEVSS